MKYVLTFACLSCWPALARAERTPLPVETHYAFDDQVVAGDYPAPREVFVKLRKRGAHSTLVEVRSQFVPELLKSVEDL
jgi:hypothetical protein